MLDHLPQAERPLVQRRLRAAWATTDPDLAQQELEALARSLSRKRPGAATSLREAWPRPDRQPAGVAGKLIKTSSPPTRSRA